MTAFYNPVPGYILPVTAAWPTPNHQFKVTSTFAQHVASGRGPGIDLANGRTGDPVYAMAGGVVSARFTDTSGALVLRILHPGGLETGYAHMSAFAAGTAKGQTVVAGQRIGTVGNTGASTGPHLHGGCKNTNLAGDPEIDWWKFLYQNKTGWLTQAGVNIRVSPGAGSTPGPVFASSKPDGFLHRAADNKNLGATGTHRGIRQPVSGASTPFGNLWIPIWLDGAFRYVAKPLLTIS
jgi:murein DD-endopeptidase MepM/ murein hydrolase activator NlpD